MGRGAGVEVLWVLVRNFTEYMYQDTGFAGTAGNVFHP